MFISLQDTLKHILGGPQARFSNFTGEKSNPVHLSSAQLVLKFSFEK